MAVHSDDSGTMITGDDIPVARVLVIRRAFIFKIDTGMHLTNKISPLKAAQTDGITDKRTYRGALRDVNKWLQARGMEPKWSRTYPKG